MDKLRSKITSRTPLENITHGLKSVHSAKLSHIQSLKSLVDSFQHLLSSENHSIVHPFTSILSHIICFADIDTAFAEKILRFQDDLRDIHERNLVMIRMSLEYKKSLSELDAAKKNFYDVKGCFQMLKETNEVSIQREKAEFEMKSARERVLKKLEEMKFKTISNIEEKKKFDKFQRRRLISGWKSFGEALIEFADKSEEEFRQMLTKITEAKNAFVEERKPELIDFSSLSKMTNQIIEMANPFDF